MDIIFSLKDESGCLEFVAYYEKKLQEAMDPFRRCRAGNFQPSELMDALRETYYSYARKDEKGEELLDFLLQKTNLSLGRYYAGTTKEIAIAPDFFVYKNEIKTILESIREKKNEKN